MQAHPGDHLVLSPVGDGPLRDGEVLEARGPGHTPPFVVLWSDGHQALVYPGPGSVRSVTPANPPRDGSAPSASPAPTAPSGHHRVHDWTVKVSIVEADDDTEAHAVLVSDSPTRLESAGHSHRRSDDPSVPEIGDQVAVARALRRLAEHLLDSAASDIEGVTGERDVVLRPR